MDSKQQMNRINLVDAATVTGARKNLFDQIKDAFGATPNMLQEI